ncbi:hypothetical protein Scep_008342 [Stephania cephalantha]|uniref:Formamidopyrimidine-DNA glycosylase catalytic domain-containing protein n=1 Tax=Stephania cephalantha TaxID=152367 RepID=A0AAP0KCQ8_9MAGN
MPELPEVEAARRAVSDHCSGKKIVSSIVADDSKVIDGVSIADFQASLDGKTILAAHRKGKNMWIQLDSPPFPSFQFGMAGAVYIKGVAVTKYKRSAVSDADEWPSKYSKLFLKLDDGLELSFTDKRRFARVRLLKDPAVVPPISELGPDALTEPMALDEFVESLSKKKIAIKALLLDQSYIAGIGNWIADEVLYQARIHPLQPAFSLSKGSCESLHKCIKEVVQYAVEVNADSSRFPIEWLFHFRWGKKPGKANGADSSQFPENWIFHSREKKPGKAFVDGKKIEFITAGGRTTAYVPELQKLPEDQAKKELAKATKHSHGGGEEEESEEEENKSKKGQKKATGVAKAPPSKKKSKGRRDSDSDSDDDDEDGEQPKKKTKVTASKQSKEVTKKSKTKTDTTKEKDSGTDGEQAKKNTRVTANNKQLKAEEVKSKAEANTTQKSKSKKRK